MPATIETRPRRLSVWVLWLVVAATAVHAQSVPDAPSANLARAPSPLSKQFLRDVAHDEERIWTSPAQADRGDLLWILPLAAAIAVPAAVADKPASDAVASDVNVIRGSRKFSDATTYSLVAATGATFLAGHFTGDERARETGVLGMEALAHTSVVMEAMKVAFNRAYPGRHREGDFWAGGKSFPSGHTALAMTMATVIAKEYPEKTKLKVLVYGLSAAVAASRVTGRKHFPSDVIAGGAIGYLVGDFVVRQHGTGTSSHVIAILPAADPRTHTYAIRLQLRP